MKKILALALTLVMMMSICVSAFAADITSDGSAGNTDIQTLTTKEDGTDAAHFTVTIPAKIQIPWGATHVYIPYTVDCQLKTGNYLSFDVEGQNNYLIKEGVNAMIPYTLLNGDFYLSQSVIKDTTIDDHIVVTFIAENWLKVPVDNYSDLVTFTVSVVEK